MLRIAVTGGIGSGKSTVAAMLGAHGAIVIDADLLAREAVQPGTPGLAAVVGAFGVQMLGADGTLDRERLAKAVFADPAARARLNAIVHPLVGELAARRLAGVAPDAVVVHDIPLLVENALESGYDEVLVVEAPLHVRLARLRERGLAPEAASARMAAQASDEQRRAVATGVIDNAGTVEELAAQVDALWPELAGRAAQ